MEEWLGRLMAQMGFAPLGGGAPVAGGWVDSTMASPFMQDSVMRMLGVRPEVVMSPALAQQPHAIGWVHQAAPNRIYLRNDAEEWSQPTLDATLAHEATHVAQFGGTIPQALVDVMALAGVDMDPRADPEPAAYLLSDALQELRGQPALRANRPGFSSLDPEARVAILDVLGRLLAGPAKTGGMGTMGLSAAQ